MPADKLVSLFFRSRGMVAWAIVVLSAVAIWGVSRLTFNDNLADFFRADNTDYWNLVRLFDDFGADDTSCVIVLTADDWFHPEATRVLETLTENVLNVKGVERVQSLLTVNRLATGGFLGRAPRPLVPHQDARPETFAEARKLAQQHPLVRGHLLSADGQTTIVLIDVAGRDIPVGKMRPLVEAIQRALDQAVEGSRIQAMLTGIPPLRVEIYHVVRRDQAVFTAVGSVVAVIISILLFRRFTAVAIVCAGPALGTLWTIGALGIVGEPINTFNSILPALVLVVGFTDSVHIMVDIRRQLNQGQTPLLAARTAQHHLWLPCALTSLTTAVGFGSLLVAKIDVIQHFGAACAAGAVINFFAVVSIVPLLASTRLGNHLAGGRSRVMESHSYMFLYRIVQRVTRHARIVTTAGILLTAGLLAAAFTLEPDNRIAESIPADSASYQALQQCEESFGGGLYSYVVVQWPEGKELESREVLEAIYDVHQVLDQQPELGTAFSVLNVIASLPGGRNLERGVQYLDRVPDDVLVPLVRTDIHKAVVSIQTPDTGTRKMRPVFDRVEAELNQLIANRYHEFQVALTGSCVLASRNIHLIITDLCKSLSLAAIIIFGVMSVVFRSVRRGLISVLPNVFPLAAAAAMLVVARNGALEISRVIVFSVWLGIAVDDTIHFISRFDRERKEGKAVRAAVEESVSKVGAALLVTTLTLLGGFGAAIFSQLPALRVFGLLSCVALVAALAADVLVLPALLVWCEKE